MIRSFFLVLAGSLWASSALAQDLPPLRSADQAAMEKCLRSAVERDVAADQCIGTIDRPCTETPDGGTTYGLMECAARELTYWDRLLNQSYQTLRGTESPERAKALRDLQRQWLKWRDASCGWAADAYEGGTLAGVVTNNCFMLTTARRAIDLANSIQEGGLDRFSLTATSAGGSSQ